VVASKELPPIHFLKHRIRQVRCNTFLSGCQPPWPPSLCQDPTIRFVKLPLDPLACIQVHPFSQTMLTTVCPLTSQIRASSEFNSRVSRSLYSTQLLHRCRCPERHFRGNQLPDRSFGLSPLHPSPAIELHVRTAQNLQQTFVRLHSQQA